MCWIPNISNGKKPVCLKKYIQTGCLNIYKQHKQPKKSYLILLNTFN